MRAAGPDWVHAFDLLELDGENFRSLPLSERPQKALGEALGGRRLGIVLLSDRPLQPPIFYPRRYEVGASY
jgi:ATP-dependent DNA ligase